DGFYRSGDLMWRHPSGNYGVAGRSKDLINRGGGKISPAEAGKPNPAHPALVNGACVPAPDATLAERTCARGILRRGASLTLEDLVEFLPTQEIARHKLPERLAVVTSFPLSPVGKVSKKDLASAVVNLEDR